MCYVTCVWEQDPAPKPLHAGEGKLELQVLLAILLVSDFIHLGTEKF
jgi:hypothetical protein